MIVLLAFIAVTIFLAGLYQWALGGASLWKIFSLKRMEKDLPAEERRQAEREVRELEKTADRTISASLRIVAVLMILVWIFLGMQMILELFGVNMIGTISSTAKKYWQQPGVQSHTATQSRQDMLRNMGNNLRR